MCCHLSTVSRTRTPLTDTATDVSQIICPRLSSPAPRPCMGEAHVVVLDGPARDQVASVSQWAIPGPDVCVSLVTCQDEACDDKIPIEGQRFQYPQTSHGHKRNRIDVAEELVIELL